MEVCVHLINLLCFELQRFQKINILHLMFVDVGFVMNLKGGADGVQRLIKSKALKKLLKEQNASGRISGAVSSSLAILHKQGLLKVLDCVITTLLPNPFLSQNMIYEQYF